MMETAQVGKLKPVGPFDLLPLLRANVAAHLEFSTFALLCWLCFGLGSLHLSLL